MKQLILTLILVTLSAPVCLGEWTYVTESMDEDRTTTFYVDLERIRERDGYVYYWELHNYPEREQNRGLANSMSSKVYWQGDCDLFRRNPLTKSDFSQPMGEGSPRKALDNPSQNWGYPLPDSTAEATLKAVCDYVESKQNQK